MKEDKSTIRWLIVAIIVLAGAYAKVNLMALLLLIFVILHMI